MAKKAKKKIAKKKKSAPKNQGKWVSVKDLILEEVREIVRSELNKALAIELTQLRAQIETLQQRLTAVELAVTRLPRSYPYPQPQEPQQPGQPTWPPCGPWSPTLAPWPEWPWEKKG